MEPPKIAADDQESNELFVHMLDSQLPYGCEFYGCDVSLALTPMTERCFLTLTQVISALFVCELLLLRAGFSLCRFFPCSKCFFHHSTKETNSSDKYSQRIVPNCRFFP